MYVFSFLNFILLIKGIKCIFVFHCLTNFFFEMLHMSSHSSFIFFKVCIPLTHEDKHFVTVADVINKRLLNFNSDDEAQWMDLKEDCPQ